MNVPFLDLKASYLELQSEIDTAIQRVLHSGSYIGGAEVEAFENEFADFCGARHVVGVANGLDALRLALLALGVGPGDEIIVPSHTFIATWLSVSQCGATPVPVEPIEGGFNMDPQQVADRVTPRTKGIIPVHLYGEPADLASLIDIANRHGLFVLEDAAQAHGAVYRGRRIGSHGHAVAWSFYPGKNLGAFGDGGAVSTNDEALARRVRMIGNYGSRTKYVNDVIGYNSRLDPVQAAILRAKLPRIDEWNARRSSIAERYSQAFASQLAAPAGPQERQGHAWHLYAVRHPERDQLQKQLSDVGVTTLIHYPRPPHLQEAYASLGFGPGSFPMAEQYASTLLSLPIGPHLTQAQVDHVIDAVMNGVSSIS
ncbi:DegT/DnrJ/EryC1/StrS aminotransferase family protein [Devosia sp.]|uniref:DegT/DnrJ/EryC1/StrS family aminotransferase n=1 Tax=Devosia sp. TaxID=1871048 RepID=UPI002735C01F|nr:DegT/DnrJ/EryC1/StrS family aminotransferase [Devosia sp.]MDP2782150.1 DegT/DnrJ/EryC1/StrS family aminotransferase [Devosia sp.]